MAHLKPDLFPISRGRFELALFVAALFETAHLVGLFDRRAQVDGMSLAIVFTALTPWLTVLLGLAVTRLRSSVAKWILIALVAIALLSAVRIGPGRWDEPAIFLGAIAGVLQLAAIAMLFTRTGRSWTGRATADLAG
jgi:hypothetical protein